MVEMRFRPCGATVPLKNATICRLENATKQKIAYIVRDTDNEYVTNYVVEVTYLQNEAPFFLWMMLQALMRKARTQITHRYSAAT